MKKLIKKRKISETINPIYIELSISQRRSIVALLDHEMRKQRNERKERKKMLHGW